MSDTVEIESRFASKAPFPWFGGKSKAASVVWSLLGDVDHYCEPFAGSLAVLLNRPHECNRAYFSETVNDLDGLLVNAWRGIAFAPDAVAEAASWPVTEADKSARQISLLRWRDEVALDRLAGDAEWFDARMAGWWLWAVACQIGAFSGDGPWIADRATGRIFKQGKAPREPGVARGRPILVSNGAGVNGQTLREPGVARGRPILVSNGAGVNGQTLREPGVARGLPHLSSNGQGVNTAAMREPGVKRDLPHMSNNGQGVNGPTLREPGVGDYHPMTMPRLRAWMALLSARMRHVRVLNGSWTRLCTTGATHTLSVRQGGVCGLFLDPPYGLDIRAKSLYQADQSHDLATECRAWCIGAGANPKNRIVLAGFDIEHHELEQHGWTVHEWFSHDSFLAGGMGTQQGRERLWASPHCLSVEAISRPQAELFA